MRSGSTPPELATGREKTIKAIVQDKYGAPDDVLELRDIDAPVAKNDQVLVRVHTAGLHAGDCFTVRGAPFPVRMATGLFKPKYGIPGYDAAGRVEAVGDNVTRFQPGDEVFGAVQSMCVLEKTSLRTNPQTSRLRKRPPYQPPHSRRCTHFVMWEKYGRVRRCSSMVHREALERSACRLPSRLGQK